MRNLENLNLMWLIGQHHIIYRTKAVYLSDSIFKFTEFSLNEFKMTDKELKLIAAAAIIGDKRIPKNGYNNPAATGTPSTL